VIARWISCRRAGSMESGGRGGRAPLVVTGVRITAGTWNLGLGIILLAHGYRWAWLLFVVSALVFSAAYVLARGTSGARRRSQS
jgi:hypothetical protein